MIFALFAVFLVFLIAFGAGMLSAAALIGHGTTAPRPVDHDWSIEAVPAATFDLPTVQLELQRQIKDPDYETLKKLERIPIGARIFVDAPDFDEQLAVTRLLAEERRMALELNA